MKKRIGFIGLGIMGKPMSENLMKAGYELTVYNRSSRPSLSQLALLGAKTGASPRQVAQNSDVVIIMVTDTPDVEQVVLGREGVIEGVRRGMTVIDMSTISPSVTKMIAGRLSGVGVSMLDAPVSGGEKGAKEGTLAIMVGGPQEAYDDCLPLFQAMGKKVTRMGENGAGQLTKLANQILVACSMLAVSECMVFAKKAGLDQNKVIEALSAGAASSWTLSNLAPRAVDRDFAPGFKVKLLQKDLRLLMSAADDLKVSLPNTSLAHQLYNTLEADGRSEDGTQRLLEVLEDLSNVGEPAPR
jgi:2-hydroxy-3-oxopropionate reductase